MDIQTLIVALLVPACFVYVVWVLMPSGLRRRLATWLARFAWPAPMRRLLGREAAASPGCHCSGCDQAADVGHQADHAVVTVYPRRPDAE